MMPTASADEGYQEGASLLVYAERLEALSAALEAPGDARCQLHDAVIELASLAQIQRLQAGLAPDPYLAGAICQLGERPSS